MRIELAQDVTPGDYLLDYESAVKDIQLVTDPYPEGTHAEIQMANGRTVMLPGHEEVAID